MLLCQSCFNILDLEFVQTNTDLFIQSYCIHVLKWFVACTKYAEHAQLD